MDINKRDEYRKNTPVDERLAKATERMLDHVIRKNLNWRQKQHLRSWTMEAAHSVFELHPELREEGSMLRYFVAKSGRAQGIYGKALTEYIENEYQQGTWWKHIPEEILKASM
jgi:hypothetical protein